LAFTVALLPKRQIDRVHSRIHSRPAIVQPLGGKLTSKRLELPAGQRLAFLAVVEQPGERQG
jgi:hypothetical protein